MELYNNARDVDYFVFDELDRPFPFIVNDNIWIRMMFRNMRGFAVSGADRQGVEAIAQYVIKCMGHQPGFSRDLIIRQFEKEYGDDIGERLQRFETLGNQNGFSGGSTLIETMSKGIEISMSKAFQLGASSK